MREIIKFPQFIYPKKNSSTEQEYIDAFLEILQKHKIDLIVLAGYMKMVPMAVISVFKNRIINIHPALIPSFCGQGFYGMKVHEAVIESGVRLTGVTVHFVDEVYDHGPIVLQVPVKVKDNDTPESLQKRVLKYEHRCLPEAIKLLESKNFKVIGRKVVFN